MVADKSLLSVSLQNQSKRSESDTEFFDICEATSPYSSNDESCLQNESDRASEINCLQAKQNVLLLDTDRNLSNNQDYTILQPQMNDDQIYLAVTPLVSDFATVNLSNSSNMQLLPSISAKHEIISAACDLDIDTLADAKDCILIQTQSTEKIAAKNYKDTLFGTADTIVESQLITNQITFDFQPLPTTTNILMLKDIAESDVKSQKNKSDDKFEQIELSQNSECPEISHTMSKPDFSPPSQLSSLSSPENNKLVSPTSEDAAEGKQTHIENSIVSTESTSDDVVRFRNLDTGKTVQIPLHSLDNALKDERWFFQQIFEKSMHTQPSEASNSSKSSIEINNFNSQETKSQKSKMKAFLSRASLRWRVGPKTRGEGLDVASPEQSSLQRDKSILKKQSTVTKSAWYSMLIRQPSDTNTLPQQLFVKTSGNKQSRSLQNLWLVYETRISKQIPIWCISVDSRGRWIAAGAQDGTVYLWSVNSSPEQYKAISTGIPEDECISADDVDEFETVRLSSSPSSSYECKNQNTCIDKPSPSIKATNPVKRDQKNIKSLIDDAPKHILTGHKATVVTCSWNHSPDTIILATASLDRSVRLWIVHSDKNSLCHDEPVSLIIDCADWATSVVFHPTITDLIYTSSLNGNIQKWRINSKPSMSYSRVYDSIQAGSFSSFVVEPYESLKMSELVTSIAISPNGVFLAIGLCSGRVSLYEAKTIRFCSEIECKNRRGRFADGRKVTGITWSKDSSTICVTTSDSRIRIIHLQAVSNWLKFKGHSNTQMMLYAQYSPSEDRIICGSESSWIYSWDIDLSALSAEAQKVSFLDQKFETCARHERFKAFNELLTSSYVGSQTLFDSFYERVYHLPSYNKAFSTPSYPRVDPSRNSRKFENSLVILAGNSKGLLRIFMNMS